MANRPAILEDTLGAVRRFIGAASQQQWSATVLRLGEGCMEDVHGHTWAKALPSPMRVTFACSSTKCTQGCSPTVKSLGIPRCRVSRTLMSCTLPFVGLAPSQHSVRRGLPTFTFQSTFHTQTVWRVVVSVHHPLAAALAPMQLNREQSIL
ncbi:unnamed protein product [Ectocarpus sp. 8 AP-2014]